MIGYYYKSESDAVFRRHSLEYEKNKNASRNSNTPDLNTVSSMCNANDASLSNGNNVHGSHDKSIPFG